MATVSQKSRDFAVRIVRLHRYLRSERKEFILSKQLLRSGTSIGANIAEAEYALSKSDFLAKAYIALKETSETQYWLEILYRSDYLTEDQYFSINRDAEELRRMLAFITKTMRQNMSK